MKITISSTVFISCHTLLFLVIKAKSTNVELRRYIGNFNDDWSIEFFGFFYEARVNSSDVTQIIWNFGGKSEKYDVVANSCVLAGNDVAEIDGSFCSIYRNVSTFYLWMPLKIDENHENVEVRFSAMFEDGLETESSVKIKTKECSVEEPLKVKSVRSTFNSEGSFSCNQGWMLSYIEPIYKNNPKTYCKADGRWKDEQFVHCIPEKPETQEATTSIIQNQTSTVVTAINLKTTQITTFTSEKVSTHGRATEPSKLETTEQSTSAKQTLTSVEIGIISCACIAFISIVLFILLCTRHPKSTLSLRSSFSYDNESLESEEKKL